MSNLKVIQKQNLLVIFGFLLISISSGVLLYHANKPIFSYNSIEETFEDQIVGLFPVGWLSIVNPFNVKVVNDDGNNVMEVKGTMSKITEISKRFKKTYKGSIECKVKPLDVGTGFAIHIPQLDREYNPFDDIIIIFLKGGIYVVGENNIIQLDDDPSFWEKIFLLNDDMSWAIDEQSLEDSNPLMVYEANCWYSIRIDFNREDFSLEINSAFLGTFNYPKYNPPYLASIYFIAIATPYNFRFYVDNVKIKLSHTVDYPHPANVFLLILIPISIIGFYYLFKKKTKVKNKKSV